MHCFAKEQNGNLEIGNELFCHTLPPVTEWTTEEEDESGRAEPYLCVRARFDSGEKEFRLWPDLPGFLCNRDGEELQVPGSHWSVRSVTLKPCTDTHDTFAHEDWHSCFAPETKISGNLFFLQNAVDKSVLVILSLTPDFADSVLTVKRGEQATLHNNGFGMAVFFCQAGEEEAVCRAYFRHICKPQALMGMSNTWGDRNGWSRVNQDFILREIDAAVQMGVDIVQVDDGWQAGSTADPVIFMNGRRTFSDSFWEVHRERFPQGFAPITAYAKEKGVQLGLWFAPDSRNEFALADRDLAVLRRAYQEWNIRFFKLDMIHIENPTAASHFLAFLEGIYQFGEDVSVQLDVTNGKRLGFLCGHSFGTLFAENRYTMSANYFPHNTLRNLWTISRFLPARKLQFELSNPCLNDEAYGSDPFRPSLYDFDYLFACVMLSNPLFWMEMQFLPVEKQQQLERILPVWKSLRQEFALSDVSPLGSRPDGRSLTGFLIRGDNTYLLLFREWTEADHIVLPVSAKKAETLASNAVVNAVPAEEGLRVTFDRPAAYALLRILE